MLYICIVFFMVFDLRLTMKLAICEDGLFCFMPNSLDRPPMRRKKWLLFIACYNKEIPIRYKGMSSCSYGWAKFVVRRS